MHTLEKPHRLFQAQNHGFGFVGVCKLGETSRLFQP